MTDLQQKLLEMLKEIDVICKKHDITYYLIGGSALGAVRHHGFIPWDDDADIVMTIDNLRKFESVIDQEIRPDRKYMTWKRANGYPLMFGKYINTNTTCIADSLRYSSIDWGLMIDIFVLTPIPNSARERKKFHNLIEDYSELLNPFFPMTEFSSFIRWNKWKVLSMVFGKEKILNYIYNKIFSYPEINCTHYSYSYPRIHIIYPKEIFRKPRYYPFEGSLFPVPTQVEQHFCTLYGDDWSILPDIDSRHSEHGWTIDIERPCSLYLNDYYKYANKKRLMNAYAHWKNWRMHALKRIQYNKNTLLKLQFVKESLEFTTYIETIRESLILNYQKQNLSQINDLLSFENLSVFKNSYLKSDLLVSMDDIVLEIILFILHSNGKFFMASQIVDTYIRINKRVPDNCMELVQLITDKRTIINYYQKKEFTEAMEILNKKIRSYPQDYTLLFYKLQLLSELQMINDYEFENTLTYARTLFPDSGDFIKFQADLYMKNGNRYNAIEQYKKAYSLTNNGLVQLEIKRLLTKEAVFDD